MSDLKNLKDQGLTLFLFTGRNMIDFSTKVSAAYNIIHVSCILCPVCDVEMYWCNNNKMVRTLHQ